MKTPAELLSKRFGDRNDATARAPEPTMSREESDNLFSELADDVEQATRTIDTTHYNGLGSRDIQQYPSGALNRITNNLYSVRGDVTGAHIKLMRLSNQMTAGQAERIFNNLYKMKDRIDLLQDRTAEFIRETRELSAKIADSKPVHAQKWIKQTLERAARDQFNVNGVFSNLPDFPDYVTKPLEKAQEDYMQAGKAEEADKMQKLNVFEDKVSSDIADINEFIASSATKVINDMPQKELKVLIQDLDELVEQQKYAPDNSTDKKRALFYEAMFEQVKKSQDNHLEPVEPIAEHKGPQ